MDREDNSSKQKTNKNKTISKQDLRYKRKRTSLRQAQQQGKQLYKCDYCPQNKKKSYQSYPALYIHVKDKHPGENISSAKTKERPTMNTPILKLNSMVKPSDPEKEEIERELIDIKQLLCLQMGMDLLQKKLIEKDQIGERGGQKFYAEAKEKAFAMSQVLGITQEQYQEAEKGEIFRYYYTKIFPISFGINIVKYFCKNVEFSHKLHLQMILMECLDQSLIDQDFFHEKQSLLWIEHLPLISSINQEWTKWKSINKELLSDPYKQDSQQISSQ